MAVRFASGTKLTPAQISTGDRIAADVRERVAQIDAADDEESRRAAYVDVELLHTSAAIIKGIAFRVFDS